MKFLFSFLKAKKKNFNWNLFYLIFNRDFNLSSSSCPEKLPSTPKWSASATQSSAWPLNACRPRTWTRRRRRPCQTCVSRLTSSWEVLTQFWCQASGRRSSASPSSSWVPMWHILRLATTRNPPSQLSLEARWVVQPLEGALYGQQKPMLLVLTYSFWHKWVLWDSNKCTIVSSP